MSSERGVREKGSVGTDIKCLKMVLLSTVIPDTGNTFHSFKFFFLILLFLLYIIFIFLLLCHYLLLMIRLGLP